MRPLNKPILTKELYIVKSSQNRLVVLEEIGQKALDYISEFANFQTPETYFVSTTNHFNIRSTSREYYNTIINLHRLNDIKSINKFLEVVNEKLHYAGTFIGCAETEKLRRIRLLRKFVFPFNYIYYFFDFTFKRIFPKLPITREIYFLMTNGRNRVLSKVELFGRLYRCGFEIDSEREIGTLHYFVVKKTKKVLLDDAPSHYPIISLKRIGQDGKLINIYKLRTMHSYSEYLQEYIYKMNNIDKSGKFKNDFRISPLGKVLRKFWIDELPMLFNLIKGEVKVFGVRPLSRQYYSLYSEELKKERIKYKPGLIPPYYVDLPKNIDEIMASEMKYLQLYEKNPYKTDFKYFIMAIFNIVFKGVRSR